MPSHKLDPRQRVLLAASAFATLLVAAMLQCPSLPTEVALRATLAVFAVGLSALCAAMLLDDVAARPLRERLGRPGTAPA